MELRCSCTWHHRTVDRIVAWSTFGKVVSPSLRQRRELHCSGDVSILPVLAVQGCDASHIEATGDDILPGFRISLGWL